MSGQLCDLTIFIPRTNDFSNYRIEHRVGCRAILNLVAKRKISTYLP
jgi:hypothetical protein